LRKGEFEKARFKKLVILKKKFQKRRKYLKREILKYRGFRKERF
jgi:hypothetical protein